MSSRAHVAIASILLVLAAVVTTAALAAKQPPGPSEPTHLFVVPNTADGATAIGNAKGRVLAHYDSFLLVEASDQAAGKLEDAGGQQRDDMREVDLAGRRTDVLNSKPRLTSAAAAAAPGPGLALVQFIGPVKDEWLAQVKDTGVQPITYMAQNAYLVHGSKDALAKLADLGAQGGAIRAVAPFDDADKAPQGLPGGGGKVKVAIQTLAGPEGAGARGQVAAGGRKLAGDTEVASFHTQYVELPAGQVRALVAQPEVLAVEPWVEPKLLDERAAQVMAGTLNAAGTVPPGPGYLSFLTNNGFAAGTFNFAIDVTDEGVDKGIVPAPAGSHPDLYASGSSANPSRIAYAQESTVDADARDCGGHGTNVASIAAGFNSSTGTAFEDTAGFNYGMGIAPRAKIGNSKIFNCAGSFDVGSGLGPLVDNAYANGARVSNNSWGASVAGAYNSNSQFYDAMVRDARPGTAGLQSMVEVFSAGNSGPGSTTIGAPGTAKNVITVGASENPRAIGATDGCGVPDSGADNAKDIINFSSRGPTADGRMKPDIVAPGTHVTGAAPQTGADYNGSGTCNPTFINNPGPFYSLVSGTSQASPEVAGAAADVIDWYRRTHTGKTPWPSTVKALLVNTATDEIGGSDGNGGTNGNIPTQTQGWGRVNLGTLLGDDSRDVINQNFVLGSTGSTNRRTYTVDDPSKPVKITMVYTDAPGPLAGAATVNDMDLDVALGSATFHGNVFAGGVSVPGGTNDPRNTVENVYLPAGSSGRLVVTVRGTNIVGDGVPGNADATDQDFSLVVSNASYTPSPLLTQTGTPVISGGDGDSSVLPGETVNMTTQLKNLGDGSATGISSHLSLPSSQGTVTQPDSAYPNIAPSAVASNSTPFTFQAASTVTCGSTLHFTLDVADDQGTQAVPVSVVTGKPLTAPPNSTDVPKPIADVATTTSTLTTGNARITDLNVRIPNITHTFDGDLQIDIIGPDGTTVRLFNRRGSSGDNLTNTVFDDQAATAIASGTPPFTGSFRPEESLAAFNGKFSGGTWTLRVIDNAGGDTGSINAWGITRAYRSCV